MGNKYIINSLKHIIMSKPTIVTVIKNESIKKINRAIKCKTYMRDHLKNKADDIKSSLYFYGVKEEGKLEKILLY